MKEKDAQNLITLDTLNYRKTYLKFHESPEDAEEQLKKTSKCRS